MNTKDLALQLSGMQYPFKVPKDLAAQAKKEGIVIVYGASDDLMEFEGAIDDEVGSNDGTTAWVDARGLLQDFESLDKDDKDVLRDYFKREKSVVAIEALWCAEPGYSWTYKTAIPHETFEIMEDDEHYCRGIIFSLTDVTSALSTSGV